jgi:hypothetical protein
MIKKSYVNNFVIKIITPGNNIIIIYNYIFSININKISIKYNITIVKNIVNNIYVLIIQFN